MISITYFGTHQFAATILEALLHRQGFVVKAVVTQPDRPVGRNQKIAASPVKNVAARFQLPIFQPESLKKFNFQSATNDLNVVCQYGLIIPKNIIDAPKYRAINLHASLLPAYRGASPIQSAIMNGDTETGITIMQMVEALDQGPILAQEKVSINPSDTYESLSAKMMPIAARLLAATIPLWVEGKITPQPQNDAEATYCREFTRDDGKINWSKKAQEIYNQCRALNPWPGIWTTWNGRRLKLLRVAPSPLSATAGSRFAAVDGARKKGGVVRQEASHLLIDTAQGSIEILDLQLEGKKPMSAAEFINGYPAINGATLT